MWGKVAEWATHLRVLLNAKVESAEKLSREFVEECRAGLLATKLLADAIE
jgi:hypothetical protein